jgi:hypothetical protein
VCILATSDLQAAHSAIWARGCGRAHFFLSMSTMSLLSAFSTMTGIRSGYLSRIRPASCLRFSVVLQGGAECQNQRRGVGAWCCS